MSGAAAASADPAAVLTFPVTVTLEDQLALQMRCMATPVMRAGRLRREGTMVLVATALSPLFLGVGVLIAWVSDAQRPPVGELFRSLIVEQPGALAGAALIMAVCTLGGVVLQRWLVRPRVRHFLRRVLKARPDVDPADPRLAYPALVVVDDTGIESRTATGSTLLRWGVLKRWEETAEHLMVLGHAMVGFALRISAADPQMIEQFRVVLTGRLGPASRHTEQDHPA